MAKGYFRGILDVKGVPTAGWDVCLFDETTNQILEKTVSGPDGSFTFIEYDTDKTFYFVLKDPENKWEHRISSRRHPVNYDDAVLVYRNAMHSNETYDKVEGTILIKGGVMPYNMVVNAPFPSGITPVLASDTIRADGTTTEVGKWIMNLTVNASNGTTVNIPLSLVFGLKAPTNITTSRTVGPAENTINWTHENTFGEGYRLYRSETPFDKNTLPEVYRTLPLTDTTFVDSGIGEMITYFYMIATYYEGEVIYSPLIVINAVRPWHEIMAGLTSGTLLCSYNFDPNGGRGYDDLSGNNFTAQGWGNTSNISWNGYPDPNPMDTGVIGMWGGAYVLAPKGAAGDGLNNERSFVIVCRPNTASWAWDQGGHFLFMRDGPDDGTGSFRSFGLACVHDGALMLDYNRNIKIIPCPAAWSATMQWLTIIVTHKPGVQEVWGKLTETNDPFVLLGTDNQNLNTAGASGVGSFCIGGWFGIGARGYGGEIAYFGARSGALTKAEIDQFSI